MQTTDRKQRREARIAQERADFRLQPYEYSPSEVTDDPPPHPPSCAGHAAWLQALRWRAEIRAANPEYFADEDDDEDALA